MASELVEYIMDDARNHCIDKFDLKQNKDFWFKYGWINEEEKRDLHVFYTMWEAYIEIYS